MVRRWDGGRGKAQGVTLTRIHRLVVFVQIADLDLICFASIYPTIL